METSGYFITLEGIEGAGKTTQISQLRALLERRGREVLCLREPGGTPFGDRVRQLLLDPEGGMVPMAEFFLFCASRNQLVETVIRPALKRGMVVICDRFTDSSLAYQGHARGICLDTLRRLNAMATGKLAPDLTFLLDLPVQEGLARVCARLEPSAVHDRFEREEIDFHQRVRDGFLSLAVEEPERIKVIDAARAASEIASDIEKLLGATLST